MNRFICLSALLLLLTVVPACAEKPDLNDPAVVKGLIQEMRQETGKRHDRARALLLEAGERAVPLLVEDLLESEKRGDVYGIGYTVPLLEQIGTADDATIEYILSTLDNTDSPAVAGPALSLLVVFSVPAERALPHIEPLINHPDNSISGNAAYHLWLITGEKAPLIEKLRAYLRGSEPFLRDVALRIVMDDLKSEGAELVPDVLALVYPGSEEVEDAITALTSIGPAAAEALPVLREISAARNERLSPLADVAIAAIELK